MKKCFNIGVIGAGMIADKHIQNLKTDKRASVKWICDKSEEMLKKKMELHGIEKGTADYRDILDDESVDAVIICTPPFLHTTMFLDSIKAGKHVLVEKPMCIKREDMDLIIAEADKRKDLLIMECSCRHARLQPKYAYVKKMIESGKLGDIYHIHHNHVSRQSRGGIEYNPPAKWFLNKQLAGAGPLIDWGVYDFSFHLGILGDVPEIKNVRAFTINGLDKVEHGAPVFDVEEHGAAFLEFSNGLNYYYERASNAHNETINETRIYGTKGGLRLSFPTWDSNIIEYFYVDKDGTGKAKSKKLTVDMKKHPGDEAALAKHFIDCLAGKAEPMMPIKLAAKHLDIIFRILETADPDK